jgi:hypothetical protein
METDNRLQYHNLHKYVYQNYTVYIQNNSNCYVISCEEVENFEKILQFIDDTKEAFIILSDPDAIEAIKENITTMSTLVTETDPCPGKKDSHRPFIIKRHGNVYVNLSLPTLTSRIAILILLQTMCDKLSTSILRTHQPAL